MDTNEPEYAARLKRIQGRRWKRWLDVQRPYRWNLRRLNPGRTLDVGCGLGRSLASLPTGSAGIDHNPDAVAEAKRRGLVAFTPEEFVTSACAAPVYESLLFGHVLEHMTQQDGARLVEAHLPYLRDTGKIIVLAPQELGYASDPTHVVFLDFDALRALLVGVGFEVSRSFSFPLPRAFGRFFRFNEFVVVARRLQPSHPTGCVT